MPERERVQAIPVPVALVAELRPERDDGIRPGQQDDVVARLALLERRDVVPPVRRRVVDDLEDARVALGEPVLGELRVHVGSISSANVRRQSARTNAS